MNAPARAIFQVRSVLEDALRSLDQVPVLDEPQELDQLDLQLLAARAIKRIQVRSQIVSPSLNEGQWTILLDLMACQGKQAVSISSACIASGHPPTTALRWIQLLVEIGLIAREGDAEDGRRYVLGLTSAGEAAVKGYLNI